LLQCMSLEVALLRPAAMTRVGPLAGGNADMKQTSRGGPVLTLS